MNLTSRLLISTPAMGDPRFEHSVIYLCAHGSEGAFGLVLNRPARGVDLGDVLRQLGIEARGPVAAAPVVSGGPVESQRGFVLARGPVEDPDAQALAGGMVLSASTTILRQIAQGRAPEAWILALGYAGWGAGQLESEIAQNAWLVAEADPGLVFAPDMGVKRWTRALRSMGIDPATLSSTAGHA